MMAIRLLLAGRALFSRSRNQTPLDPAAIACILACEVTRLGDVLNTIAALRHLRTVFSRARLLTIVDERYAPLLEACDTGVEFVGVSGSDTRVGLLAAIRTARRYRPDLALSLSPARRNVVIALASGAPKVVGYLHALHHHAQHLHTFPVEAEGFALAQPGEYRSEHIERRSLHVAEALTGTPAPPDRRISLRTEARWHALGVLREHVQLLDSPFVVIHPFAGWPYREWPQEHFVTVANALLNSTTCRLVYLGAKSEQRSLGSLAERTDLSGRVSTFPSHDFVLTAALLEKAEVFIGSDSGPLHLAALLGTPVIGLFGPSTPALTAPITPGGVFLYEPVPCSPCTQETCLQPHDHCMRRISPEAVIAAANRLLAMPRSQRKAAYVQ